MKKRKRILSAITAMAMVASMSVPAFATEVPAEVETTLSENAEEENIADDVPADASETADVTEAEAEKENQSEDISAPAEEEVTVTESDADLTLRDVKDAETDALTENYIKNNINSDYVTVKKMELANIIRVKQTLFNGDIVGSNETIDSVMGSIENGDTDQMRKVLGQMEGVAAVYDVDDDSNYYVSYANTMQDYAGARTQDWIFAANNDNGEELEGCIFDSKTGIAYIPKNAFNNELKSVQVQFMQVFKTDISTATSDADVLTDAADVDTVCVTDEFLDIETNVVTDPGMQESDLTVAVNGIPLAEEFYKYDSETGMLTLALAPATVQTVSITDETDSVKEKLKEMFEPTVAKAANPDSMGYYIYDYDYDYQGKGGVPSSNHVTTDYSEKPLVLPSWVTDNTWFQGTTYFQYQTGGRYNDRIYVYKEHNLYGYDPSSSSAVQNLQNDLWSQNVDWGDLEVVDYNDGQFTGRIWIGYNAAYGDETLMYESNNSSKHDIREIFSNESGKSGNFWFVTQCGHTDTPIDGKGGKDGLVNGAVTMPTYLTFLKVDRQNNYAIIGIVTAYYAGQSQVGVYKLPIKPSNGGLKLTKQDVNNANTTPQGNASLQGAVFSIRNESGSEVATITTDANGVATTAADALPLGTYTVVEKTAPTGYQKNSSWSKKVTLTQGNTIVDIGTCNDTPDLGGVKVDKGDSQFKNDTAQGNATLTGAKYTIKNTSSRAVWVNGKKYEPNADVLTITTNAQGIATTAANVLPYGSYTVRETEASKGYILNSSWSKQFTVTENGKIVDLTGDQCPENVIRGGVKIDKIDSNYKDDDAQGDATLKGAEFTIKNTSTNPVVVNGKTYAKNADVMTITTNENGEASTAANALPYGSYEIRETKPSVGYKLNEDWKVTFNIEQDGIIVDKSSDKDKAPEDVIRGNVRIEKWDKELNRKEPLAGATFEGIKFELKNASNDRVWVDNKSYEVGDVIDTLVIDKNGDASKENLPYGTYTIQEVETNESYMLTDGEPRTFEIRNNGETVFVDKQGTDLVFRNQVVRGDVEFQKISGVDQNRLRNIAFLLTQNETGEQHVIVTDQNGAYKSSSRLLRKHSKDTNVNDKVIDKYSEDDVIPESELDYKAGTWFGMGQDGSMAPVDDDLGALPYGSYTLQELRCDGNTYPIEYELIKKEFAINEPEEIIDIGTMVDNEHKRPKLMTTAMDSTTGTHEAMAKENAVIIDTVTYKNLDTSKTYKLVTKLMDKETENEVDGVIFEKEFSPFLENGTEEVELKFDATTLAGHDVVVFEYLYDIEDTDMEEPVAKHTDIEDEGQTIKFPEIGTTLTDEAKEHHYTTATDEIVLVDTVEYKNLIPDQEYTMSGTLYDPEAGEDIVDDNGKPVTAKQKFTPKEANGTVEITFKFSGVLLAGKSVVAAEEVSNEKGVVAVHADLEDEAQTVTFPNVCTTAVDESTDSHFGQLADTIKIVDTVEYSGLNLNEGTQYKVVGELMDKETGESLGITAEAPFTAEEAEGTVNVVFEFNKDQLKGNSVVVFEKLYIEGVDEEIASHEDLNDEGQTVYFPEIRTTALDKETNTHLFNADETVTIIDTISYKGLVPGEEYIVEGKLMDAATEKPLLIDGKEITASHAFVPKETEGTEDVEFKLNGKDLAGTSVVVFENVKSGDEIIAKHEDINDTDQTVKAPELKTSAKDQKDGDKEIAPTEKSVIVDTVSYKNVIPGQKMTITGKMMDKATGKEVIIDGKPVTGTATFTPEKSEGTQEVEFTFDGTKVQGSELVVFEKMFVANETGKQDDTTLVGSHEDLTDAAQTVKISKVPGKPSTPTPTKIATPTKTGDFNYLPIVGVIAAVICFAIAAVAIFRRKRA